MEIKRKQKVLRNKFWFRITICFLSLALSIIYLLSNDNSHFWSVIIGVSGSAFVWSLVELVDYFVQTHYKYESERNEFFGTIKKYFLKMKSTIRSNRDDIPMHELKNIIFELYDNINHFLSSNDIYPISSEFEKCCNYVERMRWKFDSCCTGIHDECEERDEYYKKLYDAILLVNEQKESTSKRLFDGLWAQKSECEITDIELSFDNYSLPENLIDYEIDGNIEDSFIIPGNIRKTITFIPDLDFAPFINNNKSNPLYIVLSLIFITVTNP